MMDAEGFKHFINSVEWYYAKTMPDKPHEYTSRPNADINQFVQAVNYIRDHGERRYFQGRPYIYLDVDGYSYWTMGNHPAITLIMNRAEEAYHGVKD